eukprot:GFKZ01004929.1.p1 GENE.GFKZ01004929.1~~GFKZ01004929.1.p1  ORF type:complete len:846 (-),score=118.12 GFKZ01004929.1:302-2797(-)
MTRPSRSTRRPDRPPHHLNPTRASLITLNPISSPCLCLISSHSSPPFNHVRAHFPVNNPRVPPPSHRTPRRRTRPVFNKEIVESQRLRKSGNWQEASHLLEGVREKVATDPFFLNELILVRIAQLRQRKPPLTANELYADLCRIADASPARRSTTTYNSMLSGLKGNRRVAGKEVVGEGELRVAVRLMNDMLQRECYPDQFTMSTLFQMCATAKSLTFAEYFLGTAREKFSFQPDVISGTSLLNAFVKCGELSRLEEVYEEMKGRGVIVNERAYALIISAYYQKGHHDKVIKCFEEVLESNSLQLNAFLISGVIASCVRAKDTDGVKLVYDAILKESVPLTEFLLLSMFEVAIRKGDMTFGSEILFDWGATHGLPVVSPQSCSKLIAVGKKSSKASVQQTVVEVRRIVTRMKNEAGVMPTVAVFNALISTYVKLGLLAEARRVLEVDFAEHGLTPDIVTYNTLIHGFGMSSRPELALKALQVMKRRGIQPNDATYNIMADLVLEHKHFDLSKLMSTDAEADDGAGINADSVAAQFKILRGSKSGDRTIELYRRCVQSGVRLESVVYGLILSTLVECGLMDEAKGIVGFLFVHKRLTTELANVMIELWKRWDEGGKFGMRMLEKLKQLGIAPDEITYTSVIVASSRNGLLDRAFRLLGEMQDVGLTLRDTHAWCAIIDGCGKCGQWERGLEVLKSMRAGKGGGMVPKASLECYNAGLYGAGMCGGWDGVMEIWGLMGEEGLCDGVSLSAMGSCVLKNRFRIREWGVVREVYEKMERWVEMGEGRKAEVKKLERKMVRMKWLLDVAVEGRRLKRGAGNKVCGVGEEEEEEEEE